MNSTYLEFVDKFFRTRGFPTTFGILFAGAGLALLLSMLSMIYLYGIAEWNPIVLSASLVFSIILMLLARTVLRIETVNNRYTHCPMRFNRINRKVYVFRRDGTVMVEGWDRLFFHLTRGVARWRECEVQGTGSAGTGRRCWKLSRCPISNSENAISYFRIRVLLSCPMRTRLTPKRWGSGNSSGATWKTARGTFTTWSIWCRTWTGDARHGRRGYIQSITITHCATHHGY
jgi:hypothetical protein